MPIATHWWVKDEPKQAEELLQMMLGLGHSEEERAALELIRVVSQDPLEVPNRSFAQWQELGLEV